MLDNNADTRDVSLESGNKNGENERNNNVLDQAKKLLKSTETTFMGRVDSLAKKYDVPEEDLAAFREDVSRSLSDVGVELEVELKKLIAEWKLSNDGLVLMEIIKRFGTSNEANIDESFDFGDSDGSWKFDFSSEDDRKNMLSEIMNPTWPVPTVSELKWWDSPESAN